MNHDAKHVRVLSPFQLQVELADGRAGVFDLRPHLDHTGLDALRDPAYFARVQVLYGALTWPDGEDIAPSTVAAELTATATA